MRSIANEESITIKKENNLITIIMRQQSDFHFSMILA